jgi:hypothetical protein
VAGGERGWRCTLHVFFAALLIFGLSTYLGSR